jgi:hypothetical protein
VVVKPKGSYSFKFPRGLYHRAWPDHWPKGRRDAATNAVKREVAAGMPRPDVYGCVRCYSQPATLYHHREGYDPAHELDVEPLCRSCHRLVHHKLDQPLAHEPATATIYDAEGHIKRVVEPTAEKRAAAEAKRAAEVAFDEEEARFRASKLAEATRRATPAG